MLRSSKVGQIWERLGGGSALGRDRMLAFARRVELEVMENLRLGVHRNLGVEDRAPVAERLTREIRNLKAAINVDRQARGMEPAKARWKDGGAT